MTARKTFAGPRLREIRQRLGLTQTAFAKGLGVSLSYLNQMERNHRPLSRAALIGLAEGYGVDISIFETDESARLVADLREALSDPIFDERPGMADLEILASNAPKLAHAFLTLHRAHARAGIGATRRHRRRGGRDRHPEHARLGAARHQGKCHAKPPISPG